MIASVFSFLFGAVLGYVLPAGPDPGAERDEPFAMWPAAERAAYEARRLWG